MNFIKNNWLAVVAIVLAIGGFYYPQVQQAVNSFGAVNADCSSGVTCLTNSFRILQGGNLIVDTSGTATSTAQVGCIQTTATSTATPIHLEMSTTTSLATFSGGAAITATVGGAVSWRYGVCPI